MHSLFWNRFSILWTYIIVFIQSVNTKRNGLFQNRQWRIMLLWLSIQERNLIIAFIQTTVFNITIMSHSYQDCKRNKGSNDEVQHRNHSKASHLWWECNWERHIKKGIDRMEHSTMDESVLSLYFLVEDDIG